jgi:uncharacterized protein (TIGR00661 family)
MKILYGIQGTGNGHISRAREIIPVLKKYAEVDVLLSGLHFELSLPFKVKYRVRGLGFIFGKKGGIDYMESFRKARINKLFRDVRKLPVAKYDMVINDFEPVSAWAAHLKGVPCVAFSNQYSLLMDGIPRPEKSDPLSMYILKQYAPVSYGYGLHFRQYTDRIFLPLIRNDLRGAKVKDKGHYTVYLPSVGDRRIHEVLGRLKKTEFEVFSKHTRKKYHKDNIRFFPVNGEQFAGSMLNASGVICNAGFTTASEALFMGKKLLVIPMKRQYEQLCNVAALEEVGIKSMPSLRKKHDDILLEWLGSDGGLRLDYPDVRDEIAKTLLDAIHMVK